MIKGILFDFNGTLFDDTHFHVKAWKEFAEKRANKFFTEEEVLMRFIGPSNEFTLRTLLGDGLTAEDVIYYSRKKEEDYREMVRREHSSLQLMDGAVEFLDYLKENNIPFAMATASEIENVTFYMEEIGMNRWFTMDRVVYDTGVLPNKPDPAFYIEAARRLGLTPSECMIIEDTRSGIQAAINAKAARIIAIDRTTPMELLEKYTEIHEIIHDFYGFHRFLV